LKLFSGYKFQVFAPQDETPGQLQISLPTFNNLQLYTFNPEQFQTLNFKTSNKPAIRVVLPACTPCYRNPSLAASFHQEEAWVRVFLSV
jgi:hypothetical protein